MTIRLVIFLTAISSLFSVACQKKISIEKDSGILYTCSKTNYGDSESLAKGLVGDWRWVEASTEKVTCKDKTIRLVFQPDGTCRLTDNGQEISSGPWSLKKTEEQIFILIVKSPTVYTHGRVLLCGDDLLFNNSMLDGWDNLFQRIR